MNKYKQLTKKIITLASIAGGVVILFTGIYLYTDSLVEASVPQKTAAANALQKDKSEINNLNTQLEKSSVAEASFVSIQREHNTLDFSTNNETLKDWLRNAKAQYRLSSGFKLSLPAEKIVDPKGTVSRYDIVEHPGMRLEFSALSDAHVFSFIDDMKRNAPGFIRIDSLSLKRNGDIDTKTIEQLRVGAAPYLVEAKIEFNWIGLKEKTDKKDAASPAAPATPMPGAR